MTNFYTWPYNSAKLPEDADQRKAVLHQYEEKFRAELAASPAVQDWLARYNPDSVTAFIDGYMRVKRDIVGYTEAYLHLVENEPQLQYRPQAEKALNWILQKKLFNQQCLWRAEAITLPGLRITYDFGFWEEDIRNCPYIEPITAEEVQLMQRFTETGKMDIDEDNYWVFGWQDYDDITERNEEGHLENMPAWYEFYDTYMGTGHLLLLPDVRGDKESRYVKAGREDTHKKIAAAQKDKPPYVPPKPNLNYDIPLFYDLACQYDDEHFLQLLKARMDKEKRNAAIASNEGDVDQYIRLMKEIPDLPPVRGGLSWREAIRQCYNDYENSMIQQNLPAAWEEYQLYRSTGLETASSKNNRKEKHRHFILHKMEVWILEGRELLGEPRDFNF